MRIVEIKALDNGAHDNQTVNGSLPVPEGWAIIPDDMECENFPFGEITVDDSTPPVVTSWTPGIMPVATSVLEVTQLDRIEAQIAYTAMMTGTLLEEDVYEEEN